VDFAAITGPALAKLGPWGLLVLVVAVVLAAFVKGGLVAGTSVARTETRHQSELDRLTKMWESRLTESREREKDWREAFERSETRSDLLAEQVDKLAMYAQATHSLIASYLGRST
jgi:hypothetical protein